MLQDRRAAPTCVAFLIEVIYFAGEFQQPLRVLLDCGFLAKLFPTFGFILHRFPCYRLETGLEPVRVSVDTMYINVAVAPTMTSASIPKRIVIIETP